MGAVLKIFSSVFSFSEIKELPLMKIYVLQTMRPESGSKLAIDWKSDNDVTVFLHDVVINFLLTLFCFSCRI